MKIIRTVGSIFIVIFFITIFAICGLCEPPKANDPNQLFYQGNTYYQARNFTDALLAYDKILDLKLESGNLYYNIGNSFFKTNKLGYAILFYERARDLMPYDSDLRSNLVFARSMANEPSFEDAAGNSIVRILKWPYRDYNLKTLTLITLAFYIAMVLLVALNIMNPMIAKRIRFFIFVVIIIGTYTLGIFGMRYYGQVIQKHGIVLIKNVECKYEPIDKSTTFYKLQEGAEVLILSTRDGWRRVLRADGKIGWVKKEVVEII